MALYAVRMEHGIKSVLQGFILAVSILYPLCFWPIQLLFIAVVTINKPIYDIIIEILFSNHFGCEWKLDGSTFGIRNFALHKQKRNKRFSFFVTILFLFFCYSQIFKLPNIIKRLSAHRFKCYIFTHFIRFVYVRCLSISFFKPLFILLIILRQNTFLACIFGNLDKDLKLKMIGLLKRS